MLDPEYLIARQGILSGSEEHKELMRKTVRALIDQRMFDDLYLQGRFGRQNARQIRNLLGLAKARKAEAATKGME